jgi:hypothetical protein
MKDYTGTTNQFGILCKSIKEDTRECICICKHCGGEFLCFEERFRYVSGCHDCTLKVRHAKEKEKKKNKIRRAQKNKVGSVNVYGVEIIGQTKDLHRLLCRCACGNEFEVYSCSFYKTHGCPDCKGVKEKKGNKKFYMYDDKEDLKTPEEIEKKLKEIRASGIARQARRIDDFLWQRI